VTGVQTCALPILAVNWKEEKVSTSPSKISFSSASVTVS